MVKAEEVEKAPELEVRTDAKSGKRALIESERKKGKGEVKKPRKLEVMKSKPNKKKEKLEIPSEEEEDDEDEDEDEETNTPLHSVSLGMREPSYVGKALVQMGLDADFVSEGLELMDDDMRSQLDDEWKRFHLRQCNLFVKKLELANKVTTSIMAAIQSAGETS